MNPPNGQTPLDYLNQIAPQMPKKQGFGLNMRTVLLGAAIVIVLVIALVIIASAVATARKEPWQQLSAKLTTTQTVADDAVLKLKNSQIRSTNSSLRLYLTNTQRDMDTFLKNQQIVKKEIPETITAKSGVDMIARLEDGRLNAKFDSTYAREISYQLQQILSLYQKLYQTSSGTNTKAFLTNSYNNLAPIQKAFADFSASNE